MVKCVSNCNVALDWIAHCRASGASSHSAAIDVVRSTVRSPPNKKNKFHSQSVKQAFMKLSSYLTSE